MTCALFDEMMQRLPPMPLVGDDAQSRPEVDESSGDGHETGRDGAEPRSFSIHTLPPRAAPAETAARQRVARARARMQALSAPKPTPAALSVVANDHPALPPLSEHEHARIRAALTTEESAPSSRRLSTPLRLSVHAMNATLIFVWAPLGAAAMTYALVEGENVKTSARLIVLAGLFAASFNMPLVQHMVSSVGI